MGEQFEAECQTLRSSLITVESKCHAAQSQVAQLKEKMASLDHVLRVSSHQLLTFILFNLFLFFFVWVCVCVCVTDWLLCSIGVGLAANARGGREEEEHGEGTRRVG